MTINHFLSEDTNGLNVVVTFDPARPEAILMANSSHPHYTEILFMLRAGDTRVFDMFDVAGGVLQRFQQVTDRVSWDGSNILWDGDPVHSVLAEQLSRAMADGDSRNYTALAKFWEKVESNPDTHSREQSYEFLASHSFQITEDGDVVGYKGVRSLGDDTYESSWASQVHGKPSAYVNGKAVAPLSNVPQQVGDVVTMPRSEVVHDPHRACERGLHVATRDYAGGYGTVLEVHVNPRDIVSVPTDASGAKVRVCRYKVARVAVEADTYSKPVLHNDDVSSWQGDVGYKV